MTPSGAVVRQVPADGWIARLGARIKGDLPAGAGRLQPYARVNLYWAKASLGLKMRWQRPSQEVGSCGRSVPIHFW